MNRTSPPSSLYACCDRQGDPNWESKCRYRVPNFDILVPCGSIAVARSASMRKNNLNGLEEMLGSDSGNARTIEAKLNGTGGRSCRNEITRGLILAVFLTIGSTVVPNGALVPDWGGSIQRAIRYRIRVA